MPRLASNDRGPTPEFTFWPCVAVQVVAKGQHQCTQSGHPSLFKQCAIVRGKHTILNLVIAFWASTGGRLVKKKTHEGCLFFWYFSHFLVDASSGRWLIQCSPTGQVYCPYYWTLVKLNVDRYWSPGIGLGRASLGLGVFLGQHDL